MMETAVASKLVAVELQLRVGVDLGAGAIFQHDLRALRLYSLPFSCVASQITEV
jgi:hypothetical protein